MKQSLYFSKTSKTVSKDDVSVNARLLEQGGFIYKNSAGIYTFLPLGWRVIQKIAQIIREEMNRIGGLEMFMPALHDKRYLKATGRWDVDVVFKVSEGLGKEPNFNISWTHEEIIAEIAARYVNSYRDLPFSAYQIQTKFRNEPRAKSGLLRGREFMMKDLYSFHATQADLGRFYAEVKAAYFKVFERCGLTAFYTLAAGGDFTAGNTHEFQVLSEVGEDTIFVCEKCQYAENAEISKLTAPGKCPKCAGAIKQAKAIEVGNIFPLGTKYSKAFNLNYADQAGQKHPVVMGSYGIGLGRVMATAVEVYNDEKGIIWPKSLAPFQAHLVRLGEDADVVGAADKLYADLQAGGVEVLYDDRDKSPGEKLADSDLLGIPVRLVVSGKTLKTNAVSVEIRGKGANTLVPLSQITKRINDF